jgi:hypothetical protein
MFRRFKHFVKRVLTATAPGLAGWVVEEYRQWYFRRNFKRIGGVRITNEFVATHGTKVLAGPFTGMVYVDQSVGSMFLPKLIGSYESEMKQVIEEICASDYDTIIDVGSAEGYYAVGLARQMPDVRVVAFERNAKGRKLCQKMAAANGVEKRITQLGSCDPENLGEALAEALGRRLVICDVEGYEIELLNPDLVPGLTDADLLVEFHDHFNPAISETILNRFQATHDCQVMLSTSRDPKDYPILNSLKPEDRLLALDEYRPVQKYCWMRAKHAMSPAKRSVTVSIAAVNKSAVRADANLSAISEQRAG